jgi:uncharacterized membrane protein YfcA
MIVPVFHLSDFFLILAAFLGGALNSVAGGGSFITFPTLLFYGVPPVIANASNTVALFPASFAASWAYRKDFRQVRELKVWHCVLVGLGGGIVGAELLLKTPESSFVFLIPYLLFFATLLFTFGRKLTEWLKKNYEMTPPVLLTGLFFVAIYGGYFGGGIGILLLSLLTLVGMRDIHAMNGVKSLLAGCLNGIAVVLFVAAQSVAWRESLIMMAAAIAGGFAGASTAKKVSQPLLRKIISAIGFGLTIYFFMKR